MAVASTMRVFRACPVPDVGSSAACRGSKFHSLLKAQIPWSQGKTQGIFSIQPFFAKICLENGYEFSSLRVNSLLKQSREFFCQRRELIRRAGNRREFGAKTDPLAPTHPRYVHALLAWRAAGPWARLTARQRLFRKGVDRQRSALFFVNRRRAALPSLLRGKGFTVPRRSRGAVCAGRPKPSASRSAGAADRRDETSAGPGSRARPRWHIRARRRGRA